MAFMQHEKWHEALFCHWRVEPDYLQKLLPKGLVADTTPDGSAWVGLVLLTEKGVGPGGALRKCGKKLVPSLCELDHLGANVRTYVRGPKGPGIFFFSLECDSLRATLGANVFGIPYKFAEMFRENEGCKHSFRSARNVKFSSSHNGVEVPGVECRWVRHESPDRPPSAADSWKDLTNFFVERYRVYTVRLTLLCGEVTHEPWQVEHADIVELRQDLTTSAGFPVAPEPDHTCFSPGVGPVHFHFLKPC